MEFSEHPEDIVSQAALECLAAVAEIHGKIAKLDKVRVFSGVKSDRYTECSCNTCVKYM